MRMVWRPILLSVTVSVGMLALSSISMAAPPVPCSVLTTVEVEQVVGKLNGQPQPGKEGETYWCNYEFMNGTDAMEVWVYPADGINRARSKAKTPTTVTGLGEEAFITRGMFGLNYADLYIKKGSTTVKIAIKETAGDEEKLKTLGQKAVGRF